MGPQKCTDWTCCPCRKTQKQTAKTWRVDIKLPADADDWRHVGIQEQQGECCLQSWPSKRHQRTSGRTSWSALRGRKRINTAEATAPQLEHTKAMSSELLKIKLSVAPTRGEHVSRACKIDNNRTGAGKSLILLQRQCLSLPTCRLFNSTQKAYPGWLCLTWADL